MPDAPTCIETRGGDDIVALRVDRRRSPQPRRRHAPEQATTRVHWAGEQTGSAARPRRRREPPEPLPGLAGRHLPSTPGGDRGRRTTADRCCGGRARSRTSTLQLPTTATCLTGTDADELVTYEPGRDRRRQRSVPLDPDRRLDVDLGGGDDRLDLLRLGRRIDDRRSGRDTLFGAGWCRGARSRRGRPSPAGRVDRRTVSLRPRPRRVGGRRRAAATRSTWSGRDGPDEIKVVGRSRDPPPRARR